MTWISLAVIVFGSLLLAAWVFLRAQAVETWEATRPQRWAIALAILAIALFPMFFAETNYDAPAPPANNAPPLRVGSPREPGQPWCRPGALVPRRCCSLILNWDSSLAALTAGKANPGDLLLLLPVDTAKSVIDLHATLEGEDGLEVMADPAALNQPAPPLETRTYPNDSGPEMPDGHRLAAGWIVRIPITLDPKQPWDIGDNRYPLNIAATYNVSGDAQPHIFEERAGVEAQIGGAMAQMGLAAGILPLCCLGAAFTRWRRTR